MMSRSYGRQTQLCELFRIIERTSALCRGRQVASYTSLPMFLGVKNMGRPGNQATRLVQWVYSS